MKQCGGPCGRLLPRWKFYSNALTPDGLVNKCVNCCRKQSRDYIKQHPDKRREFSANMYPGQWEDELKKQNYECDFESCHEKENLVADHDHKTGKFRAILCNRHNIGLGEFNDDLKEFREAIKYLEKHSV